MQPIRQGSEIGIITPASSLDNPESIRNGLSYLAELGFIPHIGKFVYGGKNHFAGTAQNRADDLNAMFANHQIKAIVATAGGYGCQEILPLLDYKLIKENPKPIIGFSDITALQNAIYTQTQNYSIAGIMLKYDFADNAINSLTRHSFEQIITARPQVIKAGQIVNKGFCEGILLGGNLCTLMSLAGTAYFPPLADKILLLEDIDEKSYRIARMLTQLEQQSGFEQVKAVIFGEFGNCELNHVQDRDIATVIDEFANRHQSQVIIKHFPHGHIKARYCLPLGAKVRLDADGIVPILEIGN